MREAIGNTFIVNLLLIFLGVMSALLIGSISYSKAFKVKNRIIYTIQKYGGWDIEVNGSNVVQAEIEASLKDIGYHLVLANYDCPNREGGTLLYGEPGTSKLTYHYCVYEFNNEKGHYFGVVSFMHFDIPLIGSYLQFPVYGETKSIYNVEINYNN